MIVSADRVPRDQRSQAWIECFQPLQGSVTVCCVDGEQVAHVRSAELRAQSCVLHQQIFGNGREAGEIVLPEALRRQYDHRERDDGDDHADPAHPRQHFDLLPQPDEEARVAEILRGAIHQRRQSEARRQSGNRERRDGEARELGQADDTRKEEREVSDARARDAGRERRPKMTRNLHGIFARSPMTQQMHRIVLRDADQREAEGERDSMHRAEQRAHGSQTREACTRERQYAEHDAAEATVGNQQQQDHPDCRRCTQSLRLSSCVLLDHHREFAGTAEGRLHRHSAGCALQRDVQLPQRLSLAIRIERRCLRFGDQQRAATAAIEPDVVLAPRFLHRLPALQQLEHFQRRIARQPRFEEAAGGRCEIASSRQQLGVQVLRIETLRIESRRQQEAVGEQLVWHRVERELAVRDEAKFAVTLQLRDQLARNVRELLGRRALQRDREHARCGTFADFFEQQPLFRRRRAR
jgi:hypothetical protein